MEIGDYDGMQSKAYVEFSNSESHMKLYQVLYKKVFFLLKIWRIE